MAANTSDYLPLNNISRVVDVVDRFLWTDFEAKPLLQAFLVFLGIIAIVIIVWVMVVNCLNRKVIWRMREREADPLMWKGETTLV